MIVALLIIIIAVLIFGGAAIKGVLNGLLATLSAILLIAGIAYLSSHLVSKSASEIFVIILIAIPVALFSIVAFYGIACLFLGLDPATGEKRRK